MKKQGSNFKVNDYFDSEIITDKKVKIKLLNSVQNSKGYKLLYRGSKDGFNSNTFRNNCADLGATITLYKNDSHDHAITGGYTDISWQKIPKERKMGTR